ncbi:MAG TPA: FAD-binding protein [Solirubrobacteraceae bacterium]|nr:FAD-binding protein [Solirubrobacteraceae bacterium]
MTATWRNHTGNQSCRPRGIVSPASLQELVELVRRAEREGTTVRAVGAGHAWSDVALTDGYLVLPDRLGGLLELDDGTLRPNAGTTPLVRVLGGTRLRDLNGALERAGLALPQMGGYDAQTIAGVVSTSTHGSGLRWGPFPDLVRSLDLVVAGGDVLRVEPAAGPTDPAAFASVHGDRRRLVQDDDTFAAAVCGMGCTGLIHALVIEVRERFWLNEVRTLSTWEEVRGTLTPDGVLGEGDHYELFLNPYARRDGRHSVLVTRRADCPDPGRLPPAKRERHPLTELEASLPITGVLLRLLARHLPGLMVRRFDATLRDMRDDGYASVSYRVFNIGEANKLPAFSMELGVALDGDRHLAAVDRILAIAAERRRGRRRTYHTSPIALRFVAPSRALASMMHDRATMMIELIMVDGTRRGYELLAGYEERLGDLGVRAHWGQYNGLTAERIRALYPRWEDWLAVERRLNASGVFDSPFTRRVGISR